MDAMGDVKKVTVTLPNGKSQIFKISSDNRAYPIGSTLYWTIEQFNAAIAKMRDAGAKIEEATL